MTPEQEKERAHLAQQIIDNPLWAEARETLTTRLIDGWRNSAVIQHDERERIWMLLQAAEQAFAHIESVLITGTLLQQENPHG